MWTKIGRIAPYVILYAFSFIVVGLFNFVTAEVRADILLDAEFWNKTISQSVANLIVFSTTIGLYNRRNMEEDSEYIKMMTLVNRTVQEDLESDFGQWVFDRNKLEKKRAYIEKIKGQIAAEEIKAKPQDLQIWYYGTEVVKAKNGYCKRRVRLLNLIEDKRLNQYIMSIKVDYDEINRSFIESGENKEIAKQNKKQAGIYRVVKDNAPNFALGMGFVIFINSFLYTPNEMDAAFWYQAFFSLSILIYMFILGKNYAGDYMRKVLLVDLQTRFNIIRDYLSDKVKEVNDATRLQ